MEFVQYEVTELLPLVLLRLITPRHPDIAFRKLTQANQSPLHLIMLRGYTFDALVNARTHRFLPRREVDQFLSSFERLQHAEDVTVILREARDCRLVDHRESLRAAPASARSPPLA
jgi:hypothetical protein